MRSVDWQTVRSVDWPTVRSVGWQSVGSVVWQSVRSVGWQSVRNVDWQSVTDFSAQPLGSNCQPNPYDIPEERRPQLHCGRSLKSRAVSFEIVPN